MCFHSMYLIFSQFTFSHCAQKKKERHKNQRRSTFCISKYLRFSLLFLFWESWLPFHSSSQSRHSLGWWWTPEHRWPLRTLQAREWRGRMWGSGHVKAEVGGPGQNLGNLVEQGKQIFRRKLLECVWGYRNVCAWDLILQKSREDCQLEGQYIIKSQTN